MFSSTLRTRQPWASIVPTLARSKPFSWTETVLEGCDIAFAGEGIGNHTIRILLLSTKDLEGDEARAQIARLQHLDGGKRIGIVLLLEGANAMIVFAKFQVTLLDFSLVPIVPILSTAELPACLSAWRDQVHSSARRTHRPPDVDSTKVLMSQAVHGTPLTETQTNILMDICPGFRGLARGILDPGEMGKLEGYLGKDVSKRIVRHLTHNDRFPETGL